MRRALLGDDDVSVAETMRSLGETLHHAGDVAAAAPILREVLAIYGRLGGQDIPAAPATRRQVAHVLIELGELDQAEPLLRKCAEIHGRLNLPEEKVWDRQKEAARWRRKLAATQPLSLPERPLPRGSEHREAGVP